MRKEKKEDRHFGIGMASVLMIVMIVALTTFAVLSLVSALSDQQTTERITALTSEYYEAEKAMQLQLAEVDSALLQGEEIFAEDGTLHLFEKISEERQLHVILQKGSPDEQFYDIICYELENTRDWNPDDELHIWDGGEN